MIGTDALFTSRNEKLAALTLRYRIPTIYQWREFVAAGGLMSYGGSSTDSYRLAGVYTGRILKGEKPADLPVQQATKLPLPHNWVILCPNPPRRLVLLSCEGGLRVGAFGAYQVLAVARVPVALPAPLKQEPAWLAH